MWMFEQLLIAVEAVHTSSLLLRLMFISWHFVLLCFICLVHTAVSIENIWIYDNITPLFGNLCPWVPAIDHSCQHLWQKIWLLSSIIIPFSNSEYYRANFYVWVLVKNVHNCNRLNWVFFATDLNNRNSFEE